MPLDSTSDETEKADSERKLTDADWSAIAEWAVAEKQVRQSARRDLEKQWKEIDRQLAMKAKGRSIISGSEKDWYPAIEEPLQFNALEVIEADVMNGIFPATQPSWYTVTGDTSGSFYEDNKGADVVQEGVPVKLDQESVDAILKATIDYYHECYDFRMRIALFVAEMIKYGTGPGRVKMVTPGQFTYEYRDTGNYKGPAFLPYSIRNTYLDDTPALVMHEGITVAPLLIRTENRLHDDLKLAIEKGGSSRGWNEEEFEKLEAKKGKDKRGTVDLIELEGDLIVPRSGKDSLILPNTRTLIGVSGGGPAVIRFEENKESWHSHVVGYYMRQDVDSAYGVSPLMKGWPIQEAASFVLNDVLATSALAAKPPIPYDRNDSQLAASGGPDIYPGAQWPSDNPQALVPIKVANPAELFNVYAGLIKKYEELTQANDPRRGAGVKSHTTTGAHQIDTMRSLVRTDNFVQSICDGPLPTILYMEYAMIREAVGKKGKYIPIDAVGMKGFIKVTKDLLPKRVNFRVFGAAGVADQAEKKQSFFAAANFAIQLYAAAVQTGKPIDIDFVALITEAFEIAGHQDAARFVRRAQAVPQGPPGTSAVPGGGSVDTSTLLGSLQALQG